MKPNPPQEVTKAEQSISGFKHVSVFLAEAFAHQAAEQAKAAAADQVPPGVGASEGPQT